MSKISALDVGAPNRLSLASMGRRTALLWAVVWRAVTVLLVLQIAALSLLMYLGDQEAAPPPILANAFANPFLLIHAVAGSVALVVGPLQFVRPLRARFPLVHRLTGLVYVAACAVSVPAAFMLALGSTAGPLAGAGFGVLAMLLTLCTFVGLHKAVRQRFSAHREWMIRSYALTGAAVTLRLMLLATGLAGLDFEQSYLAIAWLSWIANLGLAETYIRSRRLKGATNYTPALAGS